ncbi:MAG: gamma-glutamyltransferase [Pseudomonadota bacterium]
MQKIIYLFLLLGTIGFTSAKADVSHARVGTRGMVAADHSLASEAGLDLLKRGGNAVDAACGAAFVLGVVNPSGSGIGGGGFMLIKRPDDKLPIALDFRETAPLAADRNMYEKKGIEKDASRVGALAIAVPGEVLGCAKAIETYGKLELHQVLAPAISLAKYGFPVGPHLAKTVTLVEDTLKTHLDMSRIFLPNGKPVVVGQKMHRPKLARTLSQIARFGTKVFYSGWIAKDIVKIVKKKGGILSLKDLAKYRIAHREPLQTTYRGFDVFVMPPPSSGGVALIQSLNILSHWNLASLEHNSSDYIHLLAETLKHVFADRAQFLGDADFVTVPVRTLVSPSYTNDLTKKIGKNVLLHKDYGGKAPLNASHRDSGTSHVSVVDQQGNAVALTTTINTTFGSMVITEKSGIILNNQMDDFTTQPDTPNMFDLVQSEKNIIAPKKRPLSSMSPTLVTKDNKVVLVVGGSGGPTIISGTLQVLLNVLDFGMEPADATRALRIHHQWVPNLLRIEKGISRSIVKELKLRGRRTRFVTQPSTAIQTVLVKEKLHGASDPRKYGEPAGY